MKKLIFFLIFIFLFSCNSGEFDYFDINEKNHPDVSYMDTESPQANIIDAARDMLIVFDSIVRVMAYYGETYEADSPEFIWKVLTAALNFHGTLNASEDLVTDYFSACFGGKTVLPACAGGVTFNNGVYTFPAFETDGIVEISDMMEDTAYVNYIKDGEISERYIFTLIKNPNPVKVSKYSLLYSVKVAVVSL